MLHPCFSLCVLYFQLLCVRVQTDTKVPEKREEGWGSEIATLIKPKTCGRKEADPLEAEAEGPREVTEVYGTKIW